VVVVLLRDEEDNGPSRAALRRIGAVEEGTLRHHMLRKDGSRRDSVYFAVIREDWPDVRAHLVGLLSRSR
jgi:RimJ/RimL family protein N-acetyltransferase